MFQLVPVIIKKLTSGSANAYITVYIIIKM
jgi:hypothetical protein